jgi:hypothetical protein
VDEVEVSAKRGKGGKGQATLQTLRTTILFMLLLDVCTKLVLRGRRKLTFGTVVVVTVTIAPCHYTQAFDRGWDGVGVDVSTGRSARVCRVRIFSNVDICVCFLCIISRSLRNIEEQNTGT